MNNLTLSERSWLKPSSNVELQMRRTNLRFWSAPTGKVRPLDQTSNINRRTKFRTAKTNL